MTDDHRQLLRRTFDQSAGVYDQVRPGYPDALVDDVIGLSGIPARGRILEIGCGTGKATEAFASRGHSMDCLEIGTGLAAIASAKFAGNDDVRIIVCSFEAWESDPHIYDLIIAATSFHWVDPEVAYVKSAAVLKPAGALAVFSNTPVRKGEGFFARVQDVYRDCAPSMRNGAPGPDQERQPPSGLALFKEPVIRRYRWSTEYGTEEYIQLLSTYSDHISLPDAERGALCSGIAGLIDDEFGGTVLKHYETVLSLRLVQV